LAETETGLPESQLCAEGCCKKLLLLLPPLQWLPPAPLFFSEEM